jgi:hypothetical protein
MALDQVGNFKKVTVSTGYDASATSIVLSSGQGAELPDPASGNYNVVWWNSTDYPDPADDPNVEIVRVTAKSTDTLTVTRGQESISASTKNTGGKTYKMLNGITKKMITDISTDISAASPTVGTFTNASLSSGVLTITHSKGLTNYVRMLIISDNNEKQIIPDDVTYATNTILVDLTSYGTLTGTWEYMYL